VYKIDIARSILITAVYETLDSIRSWRASVLLLLYFAGSLMAANGFVSVVQEIEAQLLESLQVAQTDSVGSVTQTIWETDAFKKTVGRFTSDGRLAEHLVNTSPVSLFYGWISFTFAPLLMMLIASTRVAEELGSGSARFVLFRTTPLAWCLGKYLGQALVLVPALMLSGIGVWLIGFFRLSTFAPWSSAGELMMYSIKALVYTWAYLGLAIGVSQITRSSNLATVFGFIGMIGLAVLAACARYYRGTGIHQAWDVLLWLTPQGHRMDLLWPDLSHQAPATLMLLVLGLLYMAPGYFIMTRRDY
jgi:ABC-type transport system involved in multi-copper enzyme maturation permease subunit